MVTKYSVSVEGGNELNFGDLDPIFKVGGARSYNVEKWLFALHHIS